METAGVQVLVVDDDEEEFVLVRKYLKKAQAGPYHLQYVSTFEDALAAMEAADHDVCLVDYHLGERTGIELLSAMRSQGLDVPVILLTGRGSFELDLKAMEVGAFDYIEKGHLTPTLLERSIRYAMVNHRARTALREMNEELERRVRERTVELDRSNQALEQFAEMVAHDLQGPLQAITRHIGETRSAVPEGGSDRDVALAHRLLDPILLAARNMELLVQSVLECSRMGGEELPLAPVDLSLVVQEVCADFGPAIEAAGGKIDVGSMPSVQADHNMIRGVFENLIDNAIKFRSERPLEIQIRSEQKGSTWLCSVRDNGLGVDDQDEDDIFRMFRQGTSTEDYPGIGIGLTMCRKILQRHGGQIWVDSNPDGGSTFFITFPA